MLAGGLVVRSALAALTVAIAMGLAPPPVAAADAPVAPGDTELVGKVTGPGPLNFTDARWNVLGTDLGHMFEHKGRVYMVFGDTLGRPDDAGDLIQDPRSRPSHGFADWRSNSMAWFGGDASLFGPSDPNVGPRFQGMITDSANPLRAKELLPSRKQLCGDDPVELEPETFCEETVIPTASFSVGGRMFLHYISIKKFQYPQPHDYLSNHSGLAWSDDDGQTWSKSSSVTWSRDSGFAIGTATRVGGHVYLVGIPATRSGPARLARVREDDVLTKSAYRYWNGRAWTAREADAAVVVDDYVGEPSVQWNSYFGKWLMIYLQIDSPIEHSGQFVVRSADCLIGPWSEPAPLLTSEEYPSLYAPVIPPRWNDGPSVYFGMSIFLSYNVYWMKTELSGERRPGRVPCGSR